MDNIQHNVVEMERSHGLPTTLSLVVGILKGHPQESLQTFRTLFSLSLIRAFVKGLRDALLLHKYYTALQLNQFEAFREVDLVDLRVLMDFLYVNDLWTPYCTLAMTSCRCQTSEGCEFKFDNPLLIKPVLQKITVLLDRQLIQVDYTASSSFKQVLTLRRRKSVPNSLNELNVIAEEERTSNTTNQ